MGAKGFGRFWPCSIGKGGISDSKREGDGATPVGPLTVTGCLYRPDRVLKPAPWAVPIRLGDLWGDDPGDPSYNHFARAPLSANHERLTRPDPLYDIVLTTDWNWPDAVPGFGSAIFIHRWRKPRHPTEGCVAFSARDITELAGLLAPGHQIAVRG